jgi:hypothetical protein
MESRYRVKYKDKRGKTRWTEVTASSKIGAASIVMTIAEKVLMVEPVRGNQ